MNRNIYRHINEGKDSETAEGDQMIIYVIAGCIFLGVLLVRALQFTSKQMTVEPVTDITIDKEAAHRLSRAIQFRTISHQDRTQFDRKEFQALHDYLEKAFPKVHSTLTRDLIEYSLLYTWKGRNQKLNPILLMAHLDVVPVEPGTEKDWECPPFSGEIKNGYIWGRGSMDIKEGVLGILEAVETLLGEGYSPDRTIYLAFGHDEEIGGHSGALNIASLLQKRGVSLEYVLDEGGSNTQGVVPYVASPVALVGVAEKGYITLELTVESEGGHSSMPPQSTAVGILAHAVDTLEKKRFLRKIKGITKQMFEYTGPEMPFARKVIFANLWLFSPLVKCYLAKFPRTDAIIRTTTAPTIIEGGTKENVLPTKVRAVINFRILPGETMDTVIQYVRKTVNDPRVKVTPLGEAWNPSVMPSLESESFTVLKKTIRQIFPGTVVAPYLVAGATDSRHYGKITTTIFKFVPMVIAAEDLTRIHGTNERISVENYENCVKFFVQLIRNSS